MSDQLDNNNGTDNPIEYEAIQKANNHASVCPHCGHRDGVLRSTAIGDSVFIICTDCNRLYISTCVGGVYVGQIGHGRRVPMMQNRVLTVVDGSIVALDPLFDDEDHL